MNISPVTTGNAASGATTKPMKTPSTAKGSEVAHSKSVSPIHVVADKRTSPKPAPTASTKTITGSTTNMLATTLVATYDHAGNGVMRNRRAHPEARSID